MVNKITIENFNRLLLLQYGIPLGWDEHTELDITCDIVKEAIVITRHEPNCCLCGGRDTELISIAPDKRKICLECLPRIGRALMEEHGLIYTPDLLRYFIG